jgi:hypothetical protein
MVLKALLMVTHALNVSQRSSRSRRPSRSGIPASLLLRFMSSSVGLPAKQGLWRGAPCWLASALL